MSAVDPTGRLVTTTRDAAAVAAITAIVRGGEKASGDAPPYVVVVPLADRAGASERTGPPRQRRRLAACVPVLRPEGAGRRSPGGGARPRGDDSAPQHGPDHGTRHRADGSGRAAIYQIQVEGMGGPAR
jgi:hypothetical protein